MSLKTKQVFSLAFIISLIGVFSFLTPWILDGRSSLWLTQKTSSTADFLYIKKNTGTIGLYSPSGDFILNPKTPLKLLENSTLYLETSDSTVEIKTNTNNIDALTFSFAGPGTFKYVKTAGKGKKADTRLYATDQVTWSIISDPKDISHKIEVLSNGQTYLLSQNKMSIPQNDISTDHLKNILQKGLSISTSPHLDLDLTNDHLNQSHPINQKELKTELTQNTIDKVFLAKQKAFQECYENFLRKSPGSKGQVVLTFKLLNSGSVKETRVESANLEDQGLHQCLIDVVNRTQFKPFKGASFITRFPFNFE